MSEKTPLAPKVSPVSGSCDGGTALRQSCCWPLIQATRMSASSSGSARAEAGGCEMATRRRGLSGSASRSRRPQSRSSSGVACASSGRLRAATARALGRAAKTPGAKGLRTDSTGRPLTQTCTLSSPAPSRGAHRTRRTPTSAASHTGSDRMTPLARAMSLLGSCRLAQRMQRETF